MNSVCNVRRCAVLLVEPRDAFDLDMAGLFAGQSAVVSRSRWVALAPHLDAEVELDADDLAALGCVTHTNWTPLADLAGRIAGRTLERLIGNGLLICDAPEHARLRSRDERVRETHWSPVAAVSHYSSRWSDVGMDGSSEISLQHSLADIVGEFGPPPPHAIERCAEQDRVGLAAAPPSALLELMRRRTTCRNFSAAASIPASAFGALIDSVFGCHADVELQPGVHALKKSNPSGGGLQPLEAYFLVQRVDGIEAGLYHYQVKAHALEPMAMLSSVDASAAALRFVAGQSYLADAPVLVAIVARFARSFWKYRRHPKAYRAIVLEAGHVAQNLYLAATEAEMGAYVTAAINEVDIERAFGLDPLCESPIAVCGFGPRADVKTTREFDPLGVVWNGDARIAADQ